MIHCDTQSAKMWFPGSLNLLGPFFAIVGEAAFVGLWDHRGLSIQCLSPSCHQPGGKKKTPILKKCEELVVESIFF